MNLEDLKKRATASEITLIETVEKALQAEMTRRIKEEAVRFIRAHPPVIDRFEKPDVTIREWVARFEKHLNPDSP